MISFLVGKTEIQKLDENLIYLLLLFTTIPLPKWMNFYLVHFLKKKKSNIHMEAVSI